MKIFMVCGGLVSKAPVGDYGVQYRVDLLEHPYFYDISREDLLLHLYDHPRRDGSYITVGGCLTWTAEQFLHSIRAEINQQKAWRTVLSENNYVSQNLGEKYNKVVAQRIQDYANECVAEMEKTLVDEQASLRDVRWAVCGVTHDNDSHVIEEYPTKQEAERRCWNLPKEERFAWYYVAMTHEA